MGVVVLVAGAIFALSMLPQTRATASATMRFTGQFTDLGPDDLQFPRFPERSTILARDRSVLATLYLDENRKVVRLQDIAPIARQAVIAIEDDGFYEHGALDVAGILRAAFKNLKAGEVTEGGSTITQQLVKGIFTSGERTFARKLEEARLAFRIEQAYSKDEILELYLNEVYMGRSVNGIEAASEFYFAKSSRSLTLSEAAMLAGLIAAPEAFNPVTEPEAALARRNHVLDRMMVLDMVTEAEGEAAQTEPIVLDDSLRTTNKPGRAPYFVEYIRNTILKDKTFGRTLAERKRALYQGGLQIHTTLDPKWLRYAKDSVQGQLPLPEDPESAVVTIESTNGAIRTLLGGTDFEDQQFDLATQGLRQPGSAAKPFTLVAALEQGIPAGKVYNKASPALISGCGSPDPWPVHNAEGGTAEGYINMAEATAQSVNVYFAQLIKDAGPSSVVDAAERMGVRSELVPVCSMTLGGVEVTPLDMASAYATLANDGLYCAPFAIQRVEGPNGELVHRHAKECKQVVDPKIVATVSSFLQGVVHGGTGGNAYIQRPMAGKTGTTNEHSDGWFVGYLHQQLSTAVWVGDIRGAIPIENRGSIEGSLFGGNKPALIWHDYMIRAAEGLPVTSFPAAPPLPSAEVPDVLGLTETEAIDVLGEANFTAIVEQKPAVGPAGVVVQQDPGGGASVTAGSAVTIWVSNGKTPMRRVPNVIGDTQQDAHNRLTEMEFEVVVENVDVHDQDEEGMVLDQDPQPGKKVALGSTVTIVVGRYVPEQSPSPSTSVSPSYNCNPNGTPRCDPPSGGAPVGAGQVAGGFAGVFLPLLLAAGARRRSLRPR
ncbi:MAG: transglycosylase domain-containing protein [Actinomycetota bacterium]